MARRVPIGRPQPSQLYLNGRKLALATEWFDFDEPAYDPVPVVGLTGELVLTDGHTRAALAWLAGADELLVENDPDADALDLPTYRTCVGWCRDAGVTAVGDLAGRVVNADTFEAEWVERCRELAAGDGGG